MSLSNDSREKIAPAPFLRDPINALALALVALQILLALGAFAFLPERVPIHWNIAGHVDRYASKWVSTLLFPLVSIGIYLLRRFGFGLGPRLGGRDNAAANTQIGKTLLVGILLFFLVVQLCVTAISLGVNIDLTFVLSLAISILFIITGNFMGKLRRNFWMGIRTPWTLASSVTWERTHRLGGWLFVAIGFIGILCSFVPILRFWGFIPLLLVVSISLYIYSYVCYQRLTHNEQEPLSSPFDEAN